jgi:ABC-type phosphate/phosphonate transport system ATPase subunit
LVKDLKSGTKDIIALVGPSGAGKSFLVRQLLHQHLEKEKWEIISLTPTGTMTYLLSEEARRLFPDIALWYPQLRPGL